MPTYILTMTTACSDLDLDLKNIPLTTPSIEKSVEENQETKDERDENGEDDKDEPVEFEPEPEPPKPKETRRKKTRQTRFNVHLGKEVPNELPSVEDNQDILEHKENRRRLSERLESDPEFRARYIQEEEEARTKRLIESLQETENVDDVARQNPEDGSETGSFIGETPEGVKKEKTMETESMKPKFHGQAGVYIHHVENLNITINF